MLLREEIYAKLDEAEAENLILRTAISEALIQLNEYDCKFAATVALRTAILITNERHGRD